MWHDNSLVLQSSKQYSKFPDLGLLVPIYDMTFNTHLNDILLKETENKRNIIFLYVFTCLRERERGGGI